MNTPLLRALIPLALLASLVACGESSPSEAPAPAAQVASFPDLVDRSIRLKDGALSVLEAHMDDVDEAAEALARYAATQTDALARIRTESAQLKALIKADPDLSGQLVAGMSRLLAEMDKLKARREALPAELIKNQRVEATMATLKTN